MADAEHLHEAIRKSGTRRVKVRVVGSWGFTSIATAPIEIPTSCDPAWSPSADERADFQIGKGCAFKWHGDWPSVVESVQFRPDATPSKPVQAILRRHPDGSAELRFDFHADQAGPGTLEVLEFGSDKPALSLPLTLGEASPEIGRIKPHQGETQVELKGKHLDHIQALVLGNRRFAPVPKADEDDEQRTFKAEDGKPFEGRVGAKLHADLILKNGNHLKTGPATLLPLRPRITEIQVVPVAGKGHGLPVACAQALASTNLPSQINLIAGKGYRLPMDGAFHACLRNADDPGEIRSIPGSKMRVVGNNLKASFLVRPMELLGGRASGKLELQLVDEHGGASDWFPIPATFIDLPVISAIRPQAAGIQIIGPTLDSVELIASAPEGPWEKASLAIEEGQEILRMPGVPAKGSCYLKVFGWPDLVLRVDIPPMPPAKTTPPAPGPLAEAQPAASPLPPPQPTQGMDTKPQPAHNALSAPPQEGTR